MSAKVKISTHSPFQPLEAVMVGQSVIFQSYDRITTLPSKELQFDYQKAIKMGLAGMKEGLTESECWEMHKGLLD